MVFEKRRAVFWAFIMCVSLALIPFQVLAQTKMPEIQDLFAKELPIYDGIPQENFETQTKLISETPMGNEFLSYELRIPQNWSVQEKGMAVDILQDDPFFDDDVTPEKAQSDVRKGLMQPLGRFQSPSDIRGLNAVLSVQAERLDDYTNADRWLREFLIKEGVSIIGYESNDPSTAKVVYAKIVNGVTYIIRAQAMLNGPRMVFVQYYLPQIDWQEKRALQNQVMDSFQMLKQDKSGLEILKDYKFLDIAGFSYPERWEPQNRAVVKTEDMMDVLLNMGLAGELKGQIIINVIAADAFEGLEAELAQVRQSFDGMNLRYSEVPDAVDQSLSNTEGIIFAVHETYNARLKNTRDISHEIHIGLLSSPSHYFIVSLLTPEKEDNYLIWSENMNAFRAVYETITNL